MNQRMELEKRESIWPSNYGPSLVLRWDGDESEAKWIPEDFRDVTLYQDCIVRLPIADEDRRAEKIVVYACMSKQKHEYWMTTYH